MTEEPREHVDVPDYDDVSRECRGCGGPIRATVPALLGRGDRWVRCSDCETINRITPAASEPADADTGT